MISVNQLSLYGTVTEMNAELSVGQKASDISAHHNCRISTWTNKIFFDSEQFKSRIIFVSMFNDIVWDAKGKNELWVNNRKLIQRVRRKILSRSVIFVRIWIWKEVGRNLWLQIIRISRLICRKVQLTLVEFNHVVFRRISVLERGEWRFKGGGNTSMHFNDRK